MKNLVLAVSVLFAGSMVACAHEGKSENADTSRGKFESVTVRFAPNSSTLSTSDINQLQTVAANLNAGGHLDSVTAAVWSDREFPVNKDRELPKAQRDLAKARIEAVREALRPYKGISAHNMAEHASWYARAVNSDGAELESLFAKRDADAMDRNDFHLIQTNGGPGKAVIVFERQ